MWTVNKVSKFTGVSVRTLRYYDTIGLLKPAGTTEAGYRLYDEENVKRLGQILLLRELDFPLAEIRDMLRTDTDTDAAMAKQIALLTRKKERLEGMIAFARQLQKTGGFQMDFRVFDKERSAAYAAKAKEQWGDTDAYREFEKKTAGYSDAQQAALGGGIMRIFAEFGEMRERSPADADVQAQVQKLMDCITENFYTCTKPILASLGEMYRAGGEMTENIDAAGGAGTAAFAARAIAIFCGK